MTGVLTRRDIRDAQGERRDGGVDEGNASPTLGAPRIAGERQQLGEARKGSPQRIAEGA